VGEEGCARQQEREEQDDSWPPDGIKRSMELNRFFLFIWSAGTDGTVELGQPVEFACAGCKMHGKAISLLYISKKRTTKALFAARFSKNARQRLFHKI
jgi:hypothetical protein